MKLLEGKFAIVTGAASPRGLGKATAAMFAKHGATVAILDLDEDLAKATAAEIGPQHVGMQCDVSDKELCQKVVDELITKWGQVDILVNNAGVTQPIKLLDITGENYDFVTNVNLRGVLNMCQATLPNMKKRKTGSIVNMSSVSAKRGGGIFGGPHYSAAKAGVLGLSKAIARDFAPFNIRSNSVCPGLIGTDITAGKLSDEMETNILASIPLARIGSADDVAGCCLFLASDLSAYVTGTDIDVNGGSLIY